MSITDTKVIRLISGEELMGSVEETDTTYIIKDVCQIATSYADPTSATARIGLAPFLPYTHAKDGIEIKKDMVLFTLKPVNELLNEYSKVFGSGLVLPDTDVNTIKKAKAAPPSGNNAFVKL
jgi:hypothetical protein